MGLNSVTGQQGKSLTLTSHLVSPSAGRLMRVKRILTAVRKIRETMWGGVETRKHEPEKVYLADSEQNELMLYGTVYFLSFYSCLFPV